MPKVYVIPDESPNAFATGRNPQHAAVAATEGIMRILSREELDGVMAHELAHVKHRDILISSVAATLAAAIMMIARMAQFASFFGGGRSDDREGSNPMVLLVGIFVAPLAAMLIQAAISRSREFVADAGGAAIAGSPMGLVSALRKIEGYSQRIPHRRQSGDRAHVHHQAVQRARAVRALQHAPADGAAHQCPHGEEPLRQVARA